MIIGMFSVGVLTDKGNYFSEKNCQAKGKMKEL